MDGTYCESGHLESNSKFVLVFMLPFFQNSVSYRSGKKSVTFVLNGYLGVDENDSVIFLIRYDTGSVWRSNAFPVNRVSLVFVMDDTADIHRVQ